VEELMAEKKVFMSSTGAVHDYSAIHKVVAEKGGGFFLPQIRQSASTATPLSRACDRCKSVYEPKLKRHVNECTNQCKAV
jgi:hypothetical protein